MSSGATVRIAGVPMRHNRQLWRGLADIYGIGRTKAYEICGSLSLDPMVHFQDLTSEVVDQIRKLIASDYVVEGDLRRKNALALKRIIDLKCYRGSRHIRKLPCRGQKTKTNAKTRKRGKKGSKDTKK